MNIEALRIGATIAACVVGAVYPVVVAKTALYMVSGNSVEIGRGFCLCLTGGALFGVFLTMAVFA